MTLEWTVQDAAAHLRRPTAADDKYSRGVLGMRTGSEQYPGAAVLGVEAAHRTGVGMVRYLGPERASALVLARRPETVTESGRVQAWLIGSGTDPATRTAADTAALSAVLAGECPVVVDAGALDLVADRRGTGPLVITPHAREHDRLRERAGLAPAGVDRAADAAETAAALGVTVLLKGARTIVATPQGSIRTVEAPTAWLATAGTGDVLAGILGALTAATPPADAEAFGALAATAAVLHGRAAARASEHHSGGPIAALDVADAVASVVGELLSLGTSAGPSAGAATAASAASPGGPAPQP